MSRYIIKGLLSIILSLLTAANSFGQLKRWQLVGEWETDNNDSLYYKSDIIEFNQDANWRYGQQTCNIVVLRISKNDFKFVNTYLCSEPGSELWTNGKQSIRIRGPKTYQTLEIKILDKVDRFAVLEYKEERVNRYPWDIKKLKLRRL